jgi:hypothetical protein
MAAPAGWSSAIASLPWSGKSTAARDAVSRTLGIFHRRKQRWPKRVRWKARRGVAVRHARETPWRLAAPRCAMRSAGGEPYRRKSLGFCREGSRGLTPIRMRQPPKSKQAGKCNCDPSRHPVICRRSGHVACTISGLRANAAGAPAGRWRRQSMARPCACSVQKLPQRNETNGPDRVARAAARVGGPLDPT